MCLIKSKSFLTGLRKRGLSATSVSVSNRCYLINYSTHEIASTTVENDNDEFFRCARLTDRDNLIYYAADYPQQVIILNVFGGGVTAKNNAR